MNKRTGKLSTERRHRVFEAYRGRGQRMNSLWLIYSVKTNRDLILTSDRQLVHWLCCLETDPTVRSFSYDTVEGDGRSSARIVLVNRYDGGDEIHEVFGGQSAKSKSREYLEEYNYPNLNIKRIRTFSDAELKPNVAQSMRWLKALAFATAVRDQQHTSLQVSLIVALKERRSGIVDDLVNALVGYELPILLGMLVRMSIQRYVELDLSTTSFCYQTPWRMRESCE